MNSSAAALIECARGEPSQVLLYSPESPRTDVNHDTSHRLTVVCRLDIALPREDLVCTFKQGEW